MPATLGTWTFNARWHKDSTISATTRYLVRPGAQCRCTAQAGLNPSGRRPATGITMDRARIPFTGGGRSAGLRIRRDVDAARVNGYEHLYAARLDSNKQGPVGLAASSDTKIARWLRLQDVALLPPPGSVQHRRRRLWPMAFGASA